MASERFIELQVTPNQCRSNPQWAAELIERLKTTNAELLESIISASSEDCSDPWECCIHRPPVSGREKADR